MNQWCTGKEHWSHSSILLYQGNFQSERIRMGLEWEKNLASTSWPMERFH
jgi:hypothetical protein